MTCWLAACVTSAPHGHWVVDRTCSGCLAYAHANPELLGQPTPLRPWHHDICGKHGDDAAPKDRRYQGLVVCTECEKQDELLVAAEASEHQAAQAAEKEAFVDLWSKDMTGAAATRMALGEIFELFVMAKNAHCECCEYASEDF